MARRNKNKSGFTITGTGYRYRKKLRAINDMQDLADSLTDLTSDAVEGFGEYHQALSQQLIEEVKNVIYSQEFNPPLAALKDSTIRKKGNARIYLEHNELVENITVIAGVTGRLGLIGGGQRTRALFWYVGLNDKQHTKSSNGKTYQQIASIMEYGAKTKDGRLKQQPRPFWSVQVRDILENIASNKNTHVKASIAGVIYINRLFKNKGT